LTISTSAAKLKPMLNFSHLDSQFRALAEPTRRSILERLSHGAATVSSLAEPFDLSLAAIVQHLQVLEETGFIHTQKIGRVRTCRIAPEGFQSIAGWIAERRTLVERQLDRLGALLAEADADQPPSRPEGTPQ